jgi:hypothetical protein
MKARASHTSYGLNSREQRGSNPGVGKRFFTAGGDLLAGTLGIEKDSISGFLSWTQGTLRF